MRACDPGDGAASGARATVDAVTAGTNRIAERIGRHLSVEPDAIDAVAVGAEGRVWPPLGILIPHLLRHRIVAIFGDEAALVAVKAVTLVPVRTLWTGRSSAIFVEERGRWHTAVQVDGHRLLMQSPARDELAAALAR
jgi:hypothetical protein